MRWTLAFTSLDDAMFLFLRFFVGSEVERSFDFSRDGPVPAYFATKDGTSRPAAAATDVGASVHGHPAYKSFRGPVCRAQR